MLEYAVGIGGQVSIGGGWMDEKSERTTNSGVGSVGVASFERSGLRGVYMKTKLTDTPYYSKNLDFNHRDVVDNTAIFTAHAPFCCCSRVV